MADVILPEAQRGSSANPKSFSESRSAAYQSPFGSSSAPEFNASNTNTGKASMGPSAASPDYGKIGDQKNRAAYAQPFSTANQTDPYTPTNQLASMRGQQTPYDQAQSQVASQNNTTFTPFNYDSNAASLQRVNETNPNSPMNLLASMRGQQTPYEQAQQATANPQAISNPAGTIDSALGRQGQPGIGDAQEYFKNYGEEFKQPPGEDVGQPKNAQPGQQNAAKQYDMESFKDPNNYLDYLKNANPEQYQKVIGQIDPDRAARERSEAFAKQMAEERKAIGVENAKRIMWANTPAAGLL